MKNNKYKIVEDLVETKYDKVFKGLFKYHPTVFLLISAINKSVINSNPAYGAYKPFHADWNLPSLAQEIGKGFVKTKTDFDKATEIGSFATYLDGGQVATDIWNIEHSYGGVYDLTCPLDPSLLNVLYNRTVEFSTLITSPFAYGGILLSSAVLLLASLSKAQKNEDDIRPLSYYKNKSWKKLKKHIDKGEMDAFRCAYNEIVGGSNGIAISASNSRKLIQRLSKIIPMMKPEELLSFNLITELSRSVSGQVHRSEEFMRDITKRILGSAKIDIATLCEDIKPEVFNKLIINEKGKNGEDIQKKYTVRSVIDMYIELANMEIAKNPEFEVIASNKNAYEEVMRKASSLQNQHLVARSFSKSVSESYRIKGLINDLKNKEREFDVNRDIDPLILKEYRWSVHKNLIDKSITALTNYDNLTDREKIIEYELALNDKLNKCINKIEYFTDIDTKVSVIDGEFNKLKGAALSIIEELKNNSETSVYLSLVGKNDSKHQVRSEQYADSNYFFENSVKRIFSDRISLENKTVDYIATALKEYISEHMEKQYKNEHLHSAVIDSTVVNDQVAFERKESIKRKAARIFTYSALALNVGVNINQAGTSLHNVDYISAPINMNNILTEAITFIRAPDVVMGNFSKAVEAISSSSNIVMAAIGSVSLLLLATYTNQIAVRSEQDKYFNLEDMNSWKLIKNHISKEDLLANKKFRKEMNRSSLGLKYKDILRVINNVNPEAIVPMAIIEQHYIDNGKEDLFKDIIENINEKITYEKGCNNAEKMISEHLKTTNPKKLIRQVANSINTLNKDINPSQKIEDFNGFHRDIYARTDFLVGLHLRTKAFASSVSEMYLNKQTIRETCIVIADLESKLAQLSTVESTLENKILIRGISEKIKTEKNCLDKQCNQFAKSFNEIKSFAHAKRMFSDKDGEYQSIQDFASAILVSEFSQDKAALSAVAGFDITDSHLADKNLLFKEVLLPMTIKAGFHLEHDFTEADYFGRAMVEVIDTIMPTELDLVQSKERKEKEKEKAEKEKAENDLPSLNENRVTKANFIFCP